MARARVRPIIGGSSSPFRLARMRPPLRNPAGRRPEWCAPLIALRRARRHPGQFLHRKGNQHQKQRFQQIRPKVPAARRRRTRRESPRRLHPRPEPNRCNQATGWLRLLSPGPHWQVRSTCRAKRAPIRLTRSSRFATTGANRERRRPVSKVRKWGWLLHGSLRPPKRHPSLNSRRNPRPSPRRPGQDKSAKPRQWLARWHPGPHWLVPRRFFRLRRPILPKKPSRLTTSRANPVPCLR